MPATDDGPGDVVFPVLGRTLAAHGVSPVLCAWLDEHWLHPEHALPPHPFRIRLDCERGTEGPGLLTGERVSATLPGFTQVWYRRGGTLEWRGAGVGVRLALDGPSARIRAWGMAEPAADATAALHLALCEALRASGLLALHAAVARPPGARGGATALLARSGVGKSTTLLRLRDAGWTPLAEDLSWVEPRSGTLYGWDRGVHLWPGTIEAFLPGLADRPWRVGPDGKLFLSYEDLGVAGPRSASLTRIAPLTRAPHGEGRWESLTAAEGVRALWESAGVPLLPAAQAATSAWIASMVKHVPIQRLRVGQGKLPETVGD